MTSSAKASKVPVSRYCHTKLDVLTCALCQCRYTEPKVLPCLHTFCQKCLGDVIPAQSLSVTCPVCRQQSILPLDGVSALQTNVFILNLLNALTLPDSCTLCGSNVSRPTSKCVSCPTFLCEDCSDKHISMDNTNNNVHEVTNNHYDGDHHNHNQQDKPIGGEDDDYTHGLENGHHHCIVKLPDDVTATASPPSVNGTAGVLADVAAGSIVCPSHSGSSLKYYCSHCDTAVCETCTTAEHMGHVTMILSEAVIEHRSYLTSMVSRVRQMSPDIQKAIRDVEDVRKQLHVNTEATEVRITSLFDELATLVSERKQSALAELAQVSADKEKVLEEQKQTLDEHLTRIDSCCQLTEDSLHSGSNTEIVMMKKEIAGKLNALLTGGVVLQPETNPLALFDESEFLDLRERIHSVGNVCNNRSVPHQTTVAGEAFSGCVVGKASTVTVTLRDRKGDLVKSGLAPIIASLSSDQTEHKLTPTITDHMNGTYDITFVFLAAGVYYLSVHLFSQPTKGSPYKLRAVEATEVNGASSVRLPRTTAVKQKGVKRPSSSRSQGSSNRRTNRIEDDLLMRIGVKGRNKGEFSNPQGLCCHEDKVLVADSNNQAIQVFAPSGECRLKFGTPGRAPGKIQRPTGVAVSQNGNYLVADYDNKWISIFSPEGKYINRIGVGRLQGPKGVAVDAEGRIIVVDNKSSTILVFQPSGKLMHKFGSRGNREEQFAGPHYAAINEDNDIIVSDFHNHSVKVFDRDGNFKFSFGSNGEGNGQFNAPTGVAVDDKGHILVADWGNSRIQVFDAGGSFLSFVNTASDPLYGPQGLAVTTQGTIVVADSGNHCIKYYKYLQ